ncbi:MAG: aminotransferase class IV [Candidatus Brocadiia bacterium]
MASRQLFVSVNGQATPAAAPAIGALDRGLLYGDGLFETLRAYDGVPFLLDEHVARLNASAAQLRLCDPLDPDILRGDVVELLRLNDLGDAYIRITLTRGAHAGVLELEPTPRPTVSIVARPLHPPSPRRYERGIAAIVAAIPQSADSPLPRHKTLNYLANLLARTEARQRGADDAIRLNTRGEVAEAASSNLFLVRDGNLLTPALEANILPGITRQVVLRLAREGNREVHERTVRPEELGEADEVFLTNSIVELLPVCRIEGQPVGDGRPGPVTRELHEAYRRHVANAVAGAGV